MNRPEDLILEALSRDIADEVRPIAVDFLSGDRSHDLERRALEVYHYLSMLQSSGLSVNDVSIKSADLIHWFCGYKASGYPVLRSLRRALNQHRIP